MQSVAVVLLNGTSSSVDTNNFEHMVTLHPGSECTLFGCYIERYTSDPPTFYTMDPAHCIVGNLFMHIQIHVNTTNHSTDEDECLMHTHLCSDWANCSNTIGGYNCSCWHGYDGDGFNCSGECVILHDMFHITQPFIDKGLPCNLCTFYPNCTHTDVTIQLFHK